MTFEMVALANSILIRYSTMSIYKEKCHGADRAVASDRAPNRRLTKRHGVVEKNYLNLPILFATLAAVLVGFISFQKTAFTPFIHDEISYLFQAQTFLLGRVFNPPHSERFFFDAYHIINEGVFTSKYFPGFALTLMPFVWTGVPYLNPIVLFGVQLYLVFLLGRELFDVETARLGMALSAVSPQLVMQGCFLLSHLSCAVFLLFFVLGLIKATRNNEARWTLVSGLSLGMAFITRPLTVVGFTLPLALFLVWRLRRRRFQLSIRAAVSFIVPVLIVITALFFYNRAVTGNFLETPFDYYAEIHAPFHRYGFNTWDKYLEQSKGGRVDKAFNEYYHNHTLRDGLFISAARLNAFIDWLFGDRWIGLAALGLWLMGLRKGSRWDILIFFSWTSLQAVYVPHWYPGILAFGSNYLYEVSALVVLSMVHSGKRMLEGVLSPRVKTAMIFLVCAVVAFNSYRLLSKFKPVNMPRFMQEKLDEGGVKRGVVFLKYSERMPLEWRVMSNIPTLDSPIVFALDRGDENRKLKTYYSDRPFYRLNLPEGVLTPLSD